MSPYNKWGQSAIEHYAKINEADRLKAIAEKEELATLREKAAAFDELSGRRYFKFVHCGHHEYELSFDEEYFYGPSLIGCVNQAMKADSDKVG